MNLLRNILLGLCAGLFLFLLSLIALALLSPGNWAAR